MQKIGCVLVCRSDEVYGNSVFGSDGNAFISAAQIINSPDGESLPGAEFADDLIHIVFGMTKDFCASSMRVGCLYSKNASLNQALDNLTYFAAASAHTQWLFTKVRICWSVGIIKRHTSSNQIQCIAAVVTAVLVHTDQQGSFTGHDCKTACALTLLLFAAAVLCSDLSLMFSSEGAKRQSLS